MFERVRRWLRKARLAPPIHQPKWCANAEAQRVEPRTRATDVPLTEGELRRIRMTAGCADSQSIPKVSGAGQVHDGPNGRFQRMHNGVKVSADGYCGPWMTELIRRLEGHHEPQEERAFHEIVRLLRPGATMVELGSYWAYYSLWFLHEIADGRTLLVEPDPNSLEVGRRNFELNDARGEFFPYAIGRRSAPPRPFACESDRQTRLIRQICVDDLLARAGVTRVELLLADIQGAELDMLAGATRTIARGQIRFAFVSTHHHSISGDPLTHQKCLHFIRDHGGHILAEHNVVEGSSGDGLIVASFDPADRALPPLVLSRNHPTNSLFRELEYDLDEAWQIIAKVAHALESCSGNDARIVSIRHELKMRAAQCGIPLERLSSRPRRAA